MPQLARAVVQARNRQLIAHCRNVADARWQRFCGTTAQVLVEEVQPARDATSAGHLQLAGYGEAYQVVQVALPADATESQSQQLIGCILPVNLLACRDGVFAGELIEG